MTVGLYIIKEVVSTNMVKLQLVKLQLSTSIRIHLVVNISWVVRYKEQVEEQKVKKEKLVEIDKVKK